MNISDDCRLWMLTRMGSHCTRVGIQDPILNYLHEVRVGEIKAIARGEPTMLAKLLNRKKLKLAGRLGRLSELATGYAIAFLRLVELNGPQPSG